MELGKIGIWRTRHQRADVVGDLEALGYGTLWIGGSPSVAQMRPYFEMSSTITLASGILNVWQQTPEQTAAEWADLPLASRDRFLLGIGIGHPEATRAYKAPLATMRDFFDGLDAAPTPVPREARIAAALGPKMLDLAAERSLGTHPYFVPVEHTRIARERVGPEAIVAPEVAVVVDPDVETGRRLAREYAGGYLARSNYANNLRRLGYTDADLADAGSDRLIDAVIPHGTAEQVAEAVRAHLDAGADHVCLQPLGHGPGPIDDYRALAAALL